MTFDDLCLKIYFWPFLSYLASLKGLCPFYPITTLPPVTDTTPTTQTTPIPSIQPTPPTTTLPPCPADPLVCLPGGERPIAYCPCIDPRQQSGQTTISSLLAETFENKMNRQNLYLRLAATTSSTPVMNSEILVFSHLDKKKKRKRRKKRELKKRKEETNE